MGIIGLKQLQVAGDRGEGVVKLMGDTPCKHPELLPPTVKRQGKIGRYPEAGAGPGGSLFDLNRLSDYNNSA